MGHPARGATTVPQPGHARHPGLVVPGRFWLLPVAASQAALLRSAGFTPAHHAAHLVVAAVPVLAVLAHTRPRAGGASRVLLLVLAGHVLSVAPALLLWNGTGGEHPARLPLPDSVTGLFSASELGWYSVCVGTVALVLLLVRHRGATAYAGRCAW